MADDVWNLADVILETPSQHVGAQHDLVGKGKAHFEEGTLWLAVRPRGLGGLIPTSERRSFPVSSITGWDVQGSKIEFTSGKMGNVASNGAEVPVHICGFHCVDDASAASLTDAAVMGGLDAERISRH